jgi:ribonuclease P protein component
MISRKHRFHGRNSLRFVYSNGQTIRGPLFAVKSILNPRRSEFRVAVVVSRKVHKSAVARNRIRRRIYEAIRELKAEISQPYDIVITVFHDVILEESPKNLSKQIKKQLKMAGILKVS